MLAVYKKELRSYFNNMLGWAIMAVTLVFIGFFSVVININNLSPLFDYVLIYMIGYCIYVVLIPFVTMKSIASERHDRTEQLLLSLPIPTWKVVLAKYLAEMTFVSIPLVISAVYPLIFSLFGTINFATVYATWVTLFFLLAAMVAMGTFFSSLFENQIVAAVSTVGVFFILYFLSNIISAMPSSSLFSLVCLYVLALVFGLIVKYLTRDTTVGIICAAVPALGLLVWYIIDSDAFSGLFANMLYGLSIFDKFFNSVGYEIFDLTAIIYYISLSVVFVFITVQSVEKRRWNS
ncbi:MAG: ABC transporter permease [Firmicutes bacterium]|nr:ABC transporter permease [Bacillota bacterium]